MFSLLLILSLLSTTQSITITSTITAPIPAATESSTSYDSDPAFRSSILNSTNTYRTQHNATALTWNDTLASYASNHAAKCIWQHSGGPSGENLASHYPNTTSAVSAWGDERSEYDFTRPGFGEKTGHFTQLVWKHTASVGCGRAKCDPQQLGWMLVCEYWPPGNVEGEFVDEVQRRVDPGGKDDGQGMLISGAWQLGGGGGLWWLVGVVVLVLGRLGR